MDEQERRLEISKQNQDYGKDKGNCEKIAIRYSEKCDRLEGFIKRALDELGVPNEGYPAPVANAVEFLKEALK